MEGQWGFYLKQILNKALVSVLSAFVAGKCENGSSATIDREQDKLRFSSEKPVCMDGLVSVACARDVVGELLTAKSTRDITFGRQVITNFENDRQFDCNFDTGS